ncbi:MAG: DNA repair exonuclease [Pirellulales bacterium]
MDRSFRFLHAADLHLERPPRGLGEVPDHLRSVLALAPYRAAERVFDAALKRQVDFVVLAGDVVDPQLAGPRALVFLNEQFDRLAGQGIKVYWAGGRADRFEQFVDAWPLSDNVLRFPRKRVERVVHLRGGEPLVQILGTSTPRRKRIATADFAPDSSELFAVAVAYGKTDAEALARHSVNYWALGGEHPRRSLLRGAATGLYCGTPQGRRPRESGPHGCTLAQVDETGRVRTTFIPTDAVRYGNERVTVDESTTCEQLFQILTARAGELLVDPFGPHWIVRWKVVGSRSLADRLRVGKWSADVVARLRAEHAAKRPGAWTVSVEAASAEDVPAECYDEETLLGEFLRTVRHYQEHPDEPLALEAFLAERHAGGRLGAATLDEPAVRRRVLAEAAALGVELLRPREGGS